MTTTTSASDQQSGLNSVSMPLLQQPVTTATDLSVTTTSTTTTTTAANTGVAGYVAGAADKSLQTAKNTMGDMKQFAQDKAAQAKDFITQVPQQAKEWVGGSNTQPQENLEQWQADAADKGHEFMKYHTLHHDEQPTAFQTAKTKMGDMTQFAQGQASQAKDFITQVPQQVKEWVGGSSNTQPQENLEQWQADAADKGHEFMKYHTLHHDEQPTAFQTAKAKMGDVSQFAQDKASQAKDFIAQVPQQAKGWVGGSSNTQPQENLEQWQADAADKGHEFMKYHTLHHDEQPTAFQTAKGKMGDVSQFAQDKLIQAKDLITQVPQQARQLIGGSSNTQPQENLEQWQADAADKGHEFMKYHTLHHDEQPTALQTAKAKMGDMQQFAQDKLTQAKALITQVPQQAKQLVGTSNTTQPQENLEQWQVEAADKGHEFMKYHSLHHQSPLQTAKDQMGNMSQFVHDKGLQAKDFVTQMPQTVKGIFASGNSGQSEHRVPEGVPEGYRLQQWQIDAATRGRTWMRYQSLHPKGAVDGIKSFVQGTVQHAKSFISSQGNTTSTTSTTTITHLDHLPEGVPQGYRLQQWQIDAAQKGQAWSHRTLNTKVITTGISNFVHSTVGQAKNMIYGQSDRRQFAIVPEGVPETFNPQQWQRDAADTGARFMKSHTLHPKSATEGIKHFVQEKTEQAKKFVSTTLMSSSNNNSTNQQIQETTIITTVPVETTIITTAPVETTTTVTSSEIEQFKQQMALHGQTVQEKGEDTTSMKSKVEQVWNDMKDKVSNVISTQKDQ